MTRLSLSASVAVALVASAFSTAEAANFTGASGNWNVDANWSIVAPNTMPLVPVAPDDANLNRNDTVVVTVNTSVPQIDQLQLQNTTGGAGGNSITLQIEAGANLEMTNFSRIGRTGTTTGDTSQVIMTGGRFAQVANDFHFGWDPPSPSTMYFEISGGTFDVFDEFRLGQNDLGNADPANLSDVTTAPDKLEFHVKGSGSTIRVGELHFESNPAAVDPWMGVLRFSLDHAGTSKIVVDGQGDTALGRITFEESAALALNILSANVPTSVTLVESLVGNTGVLKRTDGVIINAGDQVSAGTFGGMEYLYKVYFDSNYDTTGTPGIYLADLQTQPASGGLPGDYNDDDKVDAADYTVWRDQLGSATALPNNDDTPGVMDDDYTRWKNNFGMNGSGSFAGSTPLPEPGAWVLLLAAALPLVTCRRLRG
jgi:hypothetical protein